MLRYLDITEDCIPRSLCTLNFLRPSYITSVGHQSTPITKPSIPWNYYFWVQSKALIFQQQDLNIPPPRHLNFPGPDQALDLDRAITKEVSCSSQSQSSNHPRLLPLKKAHCPQGRRHLGGDLLPRYVRGPARETSTYPTTTGHGPHVSKKPIIPNFIFHRRNATESTSISASPTFDEYR